MLSKSSGGRVLQANYRANEEHARPPRNAVRRERRRRKKRDHARERMQNPTKCAVRASERFMTRSVSDSEPARGRLAHHPASPLTLGVIDNEMKKTLSAFFLDVEFDIGLRREGGG